MLLAVSAFMAFAQTSIKVQTHNVVAADEQFNVTFIIEGEDKSSDFKWEPGDDFQLLWGPQQGRSTSVQMINGKTTKSVQTTYSYVLRPVKAGKFTIGRASAKVKGQDIYSDPVTIEVVASGSSSSSGQSSSQGATRQQSQSQSGVVKDDDIFLTLNLSRTDVVVGEPITATIKIYQRVNVAGFESAEFPSFNGFWSQELEAPTNIEFVRETYDGQIYNSALLRKFILIPQQQGSIRIDPAELICLVNVRVSSAGSSIFDGFFDDYRTVRKKVSSKAMTVNVAPLPAGAPASFGGGVGEFSISAKVSKDHIKTHEAASLLVTVSGRGNISLLETPKVNFPPDMEVYDTKVSDHIDRGGISGSKTYEYPFIPRSHGDFIIEPVKYSYYDVSQKKYVTLETPAVPVYVERGNESDAGGVVVSGMQPKDVRNLASDIRFINVKSPDLSPKGRFFVGSAAFWIILAALVAAAAACWASFRKIAARRADVAGTKNRKATKMALTSADIRAIGEIGIDCYWSKEFLKEQIEAFRQQLELASDLSLPVIIHSRESTEHILNILKDCRHLGLRGVMHAYSGSSETFRELQKTGDWYIGIGGVLTYKKASIADTVKDIPLERILLETDSPYLTPVPHRGKRNESSYIPHIAEFLASRKGTDIDEVAAATTQNAEILFGI